MQKIFYDKIKNLEIVDLSGKKTLKEIKERFGDSTYQEITLDETKEYHRFENGNFVKKTLKEKI